MPDPPLIEARGLSKKYCRNLRHSLRYAFSDVARSLVLQPAETTTLREHEFWALHDVSFRLMRGEGLGVIGSNGAGKSTLLKIIAGMRRPTAGAITTRGRIVALTEMGLGFDPALTGRENAYVNAAVFGIGRRDFSARIERILEYSGLGDFIDAPVGTYSTGMKARLSFSVAAHLDADLLIVDEALAVGDIHFRRRCISTIQKFLRDQGTLIFVAHDPYLVQTVCQRCLLLESGKVAFDGPAIEGIDRHLAAGKAMPSAGQPAALIDDTGPVRLGRIRVTAASPQGIRPGAPVQVELACDVQSGIAVNWGFSILTADLQTTIASCATGLASDVLRLAPGRHKLMCLIPELPLRPGTYAIRGGVGEAATNAALALRGYQDTPDFFRVEAGPSSFSSNWQSIMQDLIEIRTEWTTLAEPAP